MKTASRARRRKESSARSNRDGEWLIRPEYDFLEWGDGIIVGLQGRERCAVFGADNCVERFHVEGANLHAAACGGYALVLDGEALCAYSRRRRADPPRLPHRDALAGAGGQLILSDGDWGAAGTAVVEPSGAVLPRRDQHLLPLTDDRYAFLTMRAASYSSDALGAIRYSCRLRTACAAA